MNCKINQPHFLGPSQVSAVHVPLPRLEAHLPNNKHFKIDGGLSKK